MNSPFLHNLGHRFERDFIGTIEKGDATTAVIVLHWDGAVLPENYDVNDADTYPVPSPQTSEVNGLLHFVSVRTVEKGFGDFQTGDAIVSFDPHQEFESQRGLYFVLPNGKKYVQQSSGKEVMEYWDLILDGRPMTKTLLLRLQ